MDIILIIHYNMRNSKNKGAVEIIKLTIVQTPCAVYNDLTFKDGHASLPGFTVRSETSEGGAVMGFMGCLFVAIGLYMIACWIKD